MEAKYQEQLVLLTEMSLSDEKKVEELTKKQHKEEIQMEIERTLHFKKVFKEAQEQIKQLKQELQIIQEQRSEVCGTQQIQRDSIDDIIDQKLKDKSDELISDFTQRLQEQDMKIQDKFYSQYQDLQDEIHSANILIDNCVTVDDFDDFQTRTKALQSIKTQKFEE